MMTGVEPARKRRRHGDSRRTERNVEPIQTQIVDLPESVLIDILSFLPTKDVVRTSVLAKSWKCLWKSVTNLKFSFFEVDERLFFDVVDDVLSRRKPLNIQVFSLFTKVGYFESRTDHINSWLSYAINHKVQVLKLKYFCAFDYILPPCVFNCESLTKLKIEIFQNFEVPSCISLPSLKTLTLRDIKLSENLLRQLFSGCPILAKLAIEECSWNTLNSYCISIPTLKTLIIVECSLIGNENNCRVVITGRELVTFNYVGELKNDYSLSNLCSLVDSSIVVNTENVCKDGRKWEVFYRAQKLISGLYNARDLNLSSGFIKALDFGALQLPRLPVFRNLMFLRFNLGSIDFNCEALQSLLQNSPSLITLEFMQGVSLNISGAVKEWDLDTVPRCFSTQLKRVSIGPYTRTPAELQVIKLIKKHALVLDQFIYRIRD